MIFVTVGEQLPFDRLIRTVDEWAATSGAEVFAQTGKTECELSHIEHKEYLTPKAFGEKMLSAEAIVAHAGMGTIISALEHRKPILVMPRQAVLSEVRNNHQVSTAKRFLELKYISVAFDEMELKIKLDDLASLIASRKDSYNIGPSPLLIKTIREFIEMK